MAWKFDGLNRQALHVESQTKFSIKFDRKLKSISDFELIPPKDQLTNWSPEQIDHLKNDLWVEMNRVWEQASLRDRLRELIRKKLGGDNYRAANVICGISGKTVSARSIQAWLIEPAKRSSRTCPDWAVEALEAYVPPPEQHAPQQQAGLSPWDIQTKFAVDFAERRIEAEEQLRHKWADLPLSLLPERLSELELRLSDHLKYLNESMHVMKVKLKSSTSFEDFQGKVLEEFDNAQSIDFFIRETKKAIEQRSDEFSNVAGLPAQLGVHK